MGYIGWFSVVYGVDAVMSSESSGERLPDLSVHVESAKEPLC